MRRAHRAEANAKRKLDQSSGMVKASKRQAEGTRTALAELAAVKAENELLQSRVVELSRLFLEKDESVRVANDNTRIALEAANRDLVALLDTSLRGRGGVNSE